MQMDDVIGCKQDGNITVWSWYVMNKYLAGCLFFIGIVAVSCTYCTPKPDEIAPDATIISQSSLPPPNHSFGSYWKMVDQPNYDNGFSIIVYAMKLTGQNTILISSVPTDKGNEMSEPHMNIQMRDNIGDIELLSSSSLLSFGDLNFQVLEFGSRNIGADEMFLFVGNSGSDSYFNQQIAKFAEPPEEPSVHNGRTYMLGSPQIFEQDNYRISFEGWFPPPITIPSTLTSSAKDEISDHATIRIESLTTGKIDYLYIQFLENGEITSELIQ
jgi:hypothetical protein